MYRGSIVDTHFHVFKRSDIPQYLLLSADVVQRDFSLQDYRDATACARIVRGVIMQAADCGTGMDELAYIERLPTDPLIGRYVSYLPVDRADGPGIVEQLATHPLVAGVRFSPSQANDGRGGALDLENAVKTLECLGRHGMVYELSARPWQHDQVYDLARRVPGTTFVLGHLGKPRLAPGPQPDWFRGIERLAALPNVVCKVSPPLEGPDDRPYESDVMRPLVRHAVESFGYERVMFGTNFPVCFISVSCERWLSMLDMFLEDATVAQLDGLYHHNAARIYRLQSRTENAVSTMADA